VGKYVAMTRDERQGTLRVFISSTSEDLTPYRAVAREAAERAGFLCVGMEAFAAQGEHPAYEKCIQLVGNCAVLVVIVAHRYGWTPPGKAESITWLECKEAQRLRKASALTKNDPFMLG
jgi:8-oxo-dGTP pyrophosphatase MutT (NUDIX family)